VLVAERATGRDAAEMEAVYDRMVRSQDNVAEFARADLEFHS
jgi:DNA-binding FadR family transcriptional regulator